MPASDKNLLPDFKMIEATLPQAIAEYISEKRPIAMMLIGFRLAPASNPSESVQMDVILSQSLALDALAKNLRKLADMYEAEWLRTVPAKEA